VSVHFSSVNMTWRTPWAVFDALNDEFEFTVDGCASDGHLIERYWSESDEPLLRSWQDERVFLNPPYGREIRRWMEKAWTEQHAAEVIVGLVPSRTDTGWWHDYVMKATEIRFIRGRLSFEGVEKANPESHNAPFPSSIVVWRRT